MLDPIGPLPPEVYWRRRAIALGAVLLVVALAVWGVATVVGTFGSTTSPSAAPAPQAAPPQPAPAHPPRPEPAGVPGPPIQPVPPPPCADQDLRVAAEPVRPAFPSSGPIRLRMVVTNAGPRACVGDTNRMVRELVVSTADGKRFWSSNDCHVESTNETPLLPPGGSVRNEFVWTGVASVRNASPRQCAAQRDTATPGAYVVGARLGRLVSPPVPFRLT